MAWTERFGLRGRSIILCVLLLSGAVGAVSTGLIWYGRVESVRRMRHHALLSARASARSVEQDVLLNDRKALQHAVLAAASDEAVQLAQITDARGAVLASFQRGKGPAGGIDTDTSRVIEGPLGPNTVQVDQTAGLLSVVAPVMPSDYESLDLDPLENDDEVGAPKPLTPVGFVRLVYSLNEVDAELARHVFTTVVISIIVIVVGATVTIAAARQSLTPVQNLAATATAIAGGDLNRRASEEAVAEIGVLARAFNHMADRIREYTENLESQVRERTAELAKANESLRAEIGERTRAEDALQEEKNLLRSLVDLMEIMDVGITIQDAQYNIIYQNSFIQKQCGGLGGKCYEVYEKQPKVCDGCPVEKVFRDGQPHTAERTTPAPGGGVFYWDNTAHPIMNTAGEITSCFEVVRNVTERKRAEEELKRAHAETRHLLESIPSILISLDENDRITAWNTAAEETFGIAAQNALGRSLDDCGVQWNAGAVTEIVSACRARNKPVRRSELCFTHPDGREGFLGFTVNPMKANKNKRGRVLVVASEITEHKILEGQLLQSQRLESIGQLAAGIAHEINTPTQFVSDNARFMQSAFPKLQDLLGRYRQLLDVCRSGPVPPELAQDLEAAATQAKLDYLLEQIPEAITDSLEGLDRVANIVRAMKDFSHPGQTGICAADLNKAIESTITVARNEWKYFADMVLDLDPSLPPVPCMLGDFNQVVLNIVVNAAHAIKDVVGDGGSKGTITVATRHDDGQVEIRISDTGTGIPKEHRHKVFDHFFTTKEVGKGTGQGLAIAWHVIVEKHRGSLTLETEMGKGTTFIIRLPIEAEPAAITETLEHEEACHGKGPVR